MKRNISILKLNKKEQNYILDYIVENLIFFDMKSNKFYRRICKSTSVKLIPLKTNIRIKHGKKSGMATWCFTIEKKHYTIQPYFLLWYCYYNNVPDKNLVPLDGIWDNFSIDNWTTSDELILHNTKKRLRTLIRNKISNETYSTREYDFGLTQEYLKSIFDYDPDTGILKWKCRDDRYLDWNRRYAGKEAGRELQDGYRKITITINKISQVFSTHRLIWIISHNEYPSIIDHIDGDWNNNRLLNLRNVTCAINSHNKKMSIKNKSGITGVYYDKVRDNYASFTSFNNKSLWGPVRKNKEDAIKDRKEFIDIIGTYTKRHGT